MSAPDPWLDESRKEKKRELNTRRTGVSGRPASL